MVGPGTESQHGMRRDQLRSLWEDSVVMPDSHLWTLIVEDQMVLEIVQPSGSYLPLVTIDALDNVRSDGVMLS